MTPTASEPGQELAERLVDALRAVLQAIADHHETERDSWQSELGDAEVADYHRERRQHLVIS